METTRTALAEGVYLTCLPSEKFKTSVLSVQFVAPLSRETAPARALIPFLLRRGTRRCPDMGRLAAVLDGLYGARIDPVVRKLGERQCAGFVASFLDDRFVPGGEGLLDQAASLLGELLCDPATEGEGFVPAYFVSEKENLLDAIRSQINDKREWAARRLLSEMCAGEPYGVPRLGDEEGAAALDPRETWRAYRDMLASDRLELVWCGSAPRERVEEALAPVLAALPPRTPRELSPAAPHPAREDALRVTDIMDVGQAKLGLGLSCGSGDHIALLMGNTLFGGSSNSKLFLNVREKLSLCYYASSVFHRQKRILTVSSGIEAADYQRAYDEILAQLEAVQRGDLEDWELEGARSTVLNGYASLGDSQGKLENFYLSQAALDLHETPEGLSEEVRALDPERIFEAMRTVRLDTVYLLTGKEAEA